MSDTIRWEQDDDGVVVLTFDDPRHSANTMNEAHAASLDAALERLEAERDGLSGVVLRSAKATFFAGADLADIVRWDRRHVDEVAAIVHRNKAQIRRLETLGLPVVAAINGAALGGGLELCLACHHRVIVADPRAAVGLPEVTLGMLPGCGGIVRTVRMLGVLRALDELLLDGRRITPAQALELGIVDELVPAQEDLLPAAKAWIAARPGEAVTQPWERAGYAMPGGTPDQQPLAAALPGLAARLRKRLRGAPYPAPHHILAAAVEGAQVDLDSAFVIEGRYIVDLATGQTSTNMTQGHFFDLLEVRRRARAAEPHEVRKVLVLGAGMMGAGIAYACAKAGLDVVLKDVDRAAAERGRAHAARVVERAGTDPALLERIMPAADAADAAGADVVIEAVFEDPAVKARVFAEIEPHVAPGALLGSNTSTLPITELAATVTRPADFIGLHFFSPVDRMPLLEIIRGEQTSDATLGRALDLARRLGKTPIVVNDARGFFTSRVINAFINEGLAMLLEGVPGPTIEQASGQAGYPAPVLRLTDELNMELMASVRDAARAAGDAIEHPAFDVLDRMIAAGRPGRARGAGFYDYADGRRAGLWPGLSGLFPPVADPSALDVGDLAERLLFAEALEAVHCRDEGVITSSADANVGSLLGIGFPAWTGGVLQYVEGHPGGVAGFVARARELAAAHGERFAPPPSLVARAGDTRAHDGRGRAPRRRGGRLDPAATGA